MRMLYLPKLINSNGFVCANEASLHIRFIGCPRKLKYQLGHKSFTGHQYFDKQTILSGNLYQIHTYVMNAEQHHATKGKVDGMLLYAQTQSDIQPYLHFLNSQGNRFMVRTLDLNQQFDKIKEALDRFLEYNKREYLNKEEAWIEKNV